MGKPYAIPSLKLTTVPDHKGRVTEIDRKIAEDIKNYYDPNIFEAQVVIGHDQDLEALENNDRAPSFGKISKFVDTEDLNITDNDKDYRLLSVTDLIDEAADWVDRGLYSNASLAYYEPDNPNNPLPGKYYPIHVAILGQQPPAIKGLGKFVALKESYENNPMIKVFKESDSETFTIKRFQEEELESEGEVIDAPPLDAPQEDIVEFLDSAGEEFLRTILTEGEFGFGGEIVAFDPVPSEENNYLYNTEEGFFEGKFVDEDEEVYLFKVNDTMKEFIPENQEEPEGEVPEDTTITQEEENLLTTLSEKDIPEFVQKNLLKAFGGYNKGLYVYKLGDDALYIELGTDKQMPAYMEEGTIVPLADDSMESTTADPEEEEEESEEMVALRSRLRQYEEEEEKRKKEDSERMMGEIREFSESLYEKGQLNENVIKKSELQNFLASLDENLNQDSKVKAFSEGLAKKKSSSLKWFQNFLQKLPPQIALTDIGAFTENDTVVDNFNLDLPPNAVVDDDRMRVFKEAKAIQAQARQKGQTISYDKALEMIENH